MNDLEPTPKWADWLYGVFARIVKCLDWIASIFRRG